MGKKWPLPSAKIYPTWYGWPGFLWQYLLLYRPFVDNTVDTKLGPLNAQRICNWLLVMAQPKSSLIIEGSAWLAFPRHVVLLRWLTSLTVTLRSQSEKSSSRICVEFFLILLELPNVNLEMCKWKTSSTILSHIWSKLYCILTRLIDSGQVHPCISQGIAMSHNARA